MSSEGLRELTIERGANEHAEGSVLISMGRTRLICTASVSTDVPDFLKGTGRGWITAEYGMLPRSTHDRRPRDRNRAKPDSRSLEISRFIGRSLRAAVETDYLKETTVMLDCDVIQADGGTRTAAVNGAMVCLAEAMIWMKEKGLIPGVPLNGFVGAVSVGMIGGRPILDLDYQRDSQAEVDMNVVMLEGGRLVEIQGTAEKRPFDRAALDGMLDMAASGIEDVIKAQQEALGEDLLAELR